jgi:methyl-accepting chemotaxis protein
VAPSLPTDAAKDDIDLMNHLIKTMENTAKNMDLTLKAATNELRVAIDSSRAPIAAFNKTVDNFNSGVRDFSEFNYNLRGTVERMDVSVRDLVQGLREVSRSIERSERE